LGTVTFLFVDQSQSTAQLQALGDRRAVATRQALFDVLREGLEEHRGQEIDNTGDGLAVAFDSAVDAVSYAVGVQQLADWHNRHQPDEATLHLRVGVHTGEPIVDAHGRYFGIAMVVAQRLCAVAAAGQVLVSEIVRSLVEPRQLHSFVPAGPLALRGISADVPADVVPWEPLDIRPPISLRLSHLQSEPLVGRAGHLAWLADQWSLAQAGNRHLALLVGEPGMGKTRLAAAVAHSVFDHGGLVLYAGCQSTPHPAYQLLDDLLSPYVGATPRFELRRQLGDGSVLGRAVPALTARVPDLPEPGIMSAETERRRVVEAAEAFLHRISTTLPTLVVLDDLDHADGLTSALLHQLATGSSTAPLLVLGLRREEGIERLPLDVGRDTYRHGPIEVRRLEPLSQPEVAELLEVLTGAEPTPDLVAAVARQAAGNPRSVRRAGLGLLERAATLRVDEAVKRAETVRHDLRLVREEIVSGVLEIQRLRRPAEEATRLEGGGETGDDVAQPYRGLLSFDTDDAAFFHGRERLAAQLASRVAVGRLVTLVGASGSGKTSLLRAGLLPSLAGGVLSGSADWVAVVLRPGVGPLDALYAALAPELGTTADAVRRQVEESGHTLHMLAMDLLAGRSPNARLVLVVDQFEELFTQCRDEQQRKRFVDLLLDRSPTGSSRATVVLSVRGDYYGHCVALPGLAAELADSQVLVRPMTIEELRLAVEGPAEAAGLQLEPGLTDAVLQDVAAQPGALALMSTALLQTWERRRARTLTLAGYTGTGGVAGAVARLAEDAYLGLEPSDRQVARSILLRLAQPDAEVGDVRRRARLSELGTLDQSVERVLGYLCGRRLIVADETAAEVAHESLLRDWPRLRGWLQEDRDGRRLHRRMAQDAEAWAEEGRDPGRLWRGTRLSAALDWAQGHPDQLNATEREFLEVGRAAGAAELEGARRTNRRLRLLAGALSLLLVVALASVTIAVGQGRAVRRQKDRADAAVRLTTSRQLALQSGSQRLDRDLLLGAQAVRIQDTTQARSALLAALQLANRLVAYLPRPPSVRRDWTPAELKSAGPRLPAIAPALDHLLAFSPDGGKLLLGAGPVVEWDLHTRRLVRVLAGSRTLGGAVVVVPGPGGPQARVGVRDGSLITWDLATGRSRINPGHGLVFDESMVFSPDGRLLATQTGARTVEVRDLVSGRTTVIQSREFVVSMAFSPDDRLLGGASGDGSVQLWDAGSGRILAETAPALLLTTAAFSPDGRTLATAGNDRVVTLRDVPTLRPRLVLPGHKDIVRALAFSPDGSRIASAGGDRSIIVWDTRTGRQIGSPLVGHDDIVRALAYSPDGRTLASWADDGNVVLWDPQAEDVGKPSIKRTDPIYGLGLSPDGRVLATADGHDFVQLWDVATERQTATMSGDGYRLTTVAFSPDGRRLAAGGIDRAVVIWDVPAQRPKAILHYTGQVRSVSFSPDSRLLAAGTDDHLTVLSDADGAHPRVLHDHANVVSAVAFSPDGRLLAAGSADTTVVVWEVSTGRRLLTLSGHTQRVGGVAFSPDGRLLASASNDRTIRLWDVVRGRLLDVLRAQQGFIWGVAFSRDGKVLASASSDSTVALWDVRQRRVLALLTGHTAAVDRVVFSQVGPLLASGGDDDSVILWNSQGDPGSWPSRVCRLVNRGLTRSEWDQYVGRALPYRPVCSTAPGG
jgi:WD40 repeat protein/class 3 adenylate cyclase/energy-coupling factor transporter ATP-binding protein EcfA2